jgi:hypothetical protein
LKTVNEIIFKIVNEAREFKILGEGFFSELRDEIFGDLSSCFKTDKKFKTNYMKKLAYFIKTISFETLSLNLESLSLKNAYLQLYQFLLKKGGNYLRQDSLQILITEVWKLNNELIFDVNVQGNFKIFYLFFQGILDRTLGKTTLALTIFLIKL